MLFHKTFFWVLKGVKEWQYYLKIPTKKHDILFSFRKKIKHGGDLICAFEELPNILLNLCQFLRMTKYCI